MKKTVMVIIWIIGISGILIFAYTKKSKEEPAIVEKKEEITEIFIYQYKPEVAKEIEDLAKAYEKEFPNVKVEVETNAGRDYMAMLSSVFASGREPDIFNVGGYKELEMWQDYLLNIEEEPFMKYMKEGTLELVTTNHGIYGIPYNIEGYGILYNEEIFEELGITKLPRNNKELEELCIFLQSKGVLPFYNSHAEWWTISIHSFNTLLAVQENTEEYIKEIAAGERSFGDDAYFDNWLDYLTIMTKYGQEDPFTSGYSSQLQAFANKEAAMIQQGNWVDNLLYQMNPNIKIGIIPIPIQTKYNDKIQVGVPGYWCVNKHSKVKKEAVHFLEWMVTSKQGEKFITQDASFISGYTTIDDYDYHEISKEVVNYYKQNKTYGWYWTQLPIGYTNKLQTHIMAYLKGDMTKEELQKNMDEDLR